MHISKKQKENRNEIYYYLSFGITGVFLLIASVFYKLFISHYIIIPECMIYRVTDIYCPACGGSRAVIALLEGRIIDSLHYHPLVLYSVCLWCIYIGINGAIYLYTRKKEKMLHFSRNYILFGLLLLIINFVLKNI